jgi:DNA modification methylase
MDEQIGLEETPNEFIKSLVDVFREVKRVLRDDGTLWINIGDSYCAGSRNTSTIQTMSEKHRGEPLTRRNKATGDIKNKDLIGIPWMLAFALRADGWYLRQDIIWSKPNCMPESVKDRCTKSHEYVFLLSKSPQYFYDHAAIKEITEDCKGTRAKRSVWHVSPKPYSEAHFAVFPPELIEPCILAGSPCDGTVLDPFGGSGTTAGVAIKHGRNAILCELNEEYAALIPERIKQITNGFVAGQMTLGEY